MNIYETWLERIQADVIAEGMIRQLRLSIYPLAFDFEPSGAKTNLTEIQAGEIVRAHHARLDGGPKVTEHQADKGAQWLRNMGKRVGLPERFYTEFPLFFRLPDVELVQVDNWRFNSSRFGATFLPRYTAHYADGTILSYRVGAWQSGAYGRSPVEFHYEIKEAA